MNKYVFYVAKSKASAAGRAVFSHYKKVSAYAGSPEEAKSIIMANLPMKYRNGRLVTHVEKETLLEKKEVKKHAGS